VHTSVLGFGTRPLGVFIPIRPYFLFPVPSAFAGQLMSIVKAYVHIPGRVPLSDVILHAGYDERSVYQTSTEQCLVYRQSSICMFSLSSSARPSPKPTQDRNKKPEPPIHNLVPIVTLTTKPALSQHPICFKTTMSPNTTLIFGGSGKVARHITRLLTQTSPPYTVHSIIRKPEQAASITALGGNPIVQSIEASSVDDMAATIISTKADSIIWSAGAGGGDSSRTLAVDRDGAIKCMDAAARAGVKRFVMVSAVDVRDRERKSEPEWYDDSDRERSEGMWGAIGAYMEAKLAADKSLVSENGRRGLEFTIVRPGRLSDEEGKGRVEAGKVHLGESISREDVAEVMVECLRERGTVGLVFDVVGGQTEIGEAMRRIVEGKVDTFEGRY
jgi:nucleoside-diphosphate-sugar epimerase